jgi:plastocyanin
MNLPKKNWPRKSMSPSLLSLVAALSGCGGSSGPSGTPTPATGATVIDWFVGATNVQTTVKAGDTVQWKSTDGMAHTVTSSSAPAAFAEIGVSGGAFSSPMKFDTPGEFRYFCSIHGAGVMNGALTITP